LKDERQTWPSGQTLSDFAQRSCRALTEVLISDYFNRLWPPFIELKERLNSDFFAVGNELSQLSSRLEEYQELLAIGDNFVR